jgi:hypothetical protein
MIWMIYSRYSKYKLSFWSQLGVPHPKPSLFLGHAKLMKDVSHFFVYKNAMLL